MSLRKGSPETQVFSGSTVGKHWNKVPKYIKVQFYCFIEKIVKKLTLECCNNLEIIEIIFAHLF